MKVRILLYFPLLLALFLGINKSHAQSYCTPSATSPGINYITNVTTTDGIVNFTNSTTTGSGTSSGYTNFYSTHEVSGIQGTSFNFSVTEYGSAGYCKIWIDWNQDGVFDDPSELVYSYTTSPGAYTFTGSITIPLTALSGSTRMRVRTNWYSGTTLTPCTNMDYGEAEDYKVTVIPADPCEDVELVAGTLAGANICPSVSFTIVNSGTSLGLGFERVWQSRPAGSATWTTIAGADGVNYSSPGITEDTEYRCIVSCPSTGEEEITNTATAALNPFYECYCTPSASSPTVNYITAVSTTMGITNFTSTSTTGSGTSPGYTNYFDVHEVSAVQGTTFNFSVTETGSAGYCKIWIDWNQNGIFEDPGELVYSYTTSPGAYTFTGSIEIPLTALAGVTRMRVRTNWYAGTTLTPCTNMDYGEAEDYKVTVIPAEPCEDLELVAGTLGNVNICPSTPFTIVNSGTSLGLGFERVWQSRPAGSTTWTTIAGADGVNYNSTTGVTADTEYRCIVSCPVTGEEEITTVGTVTLNPFYDCHCIPSATWPTTNYITNVTTTEAVTNFANSTSTGSGTSPGYTDFFDIHGASAIQGTTFNINVTETGSAGYCKVWIDWNQNGIFEDPGELVYSYTTSPGAYTFAGTITVPYTALPGDTRMRVRTNWYAGTTLTPCTNMDYGEAEDYKFTVILAEPCEDIELTAGTLGNVTICPSMPFSIINTGTSLGIGFERVWQSRPVGSSTWTTIAGADGVNYNSTGITENTEYRCIVSCPASGEEAVTTVATVTLNPFYECYCIPSATYPTINYITNVTTTEGVTNFTNSTTTGSGTSPGYTNFYDVHSVSAVQGTSFDIDVTETGSAGYCKVWIDWNQNGVFEDPGELVYSYITSPGAFTFEGTIAVPITALPGETRMRVRTNWYAGTTLTPCTNMDYGEAEDYKMIVIEAIPCNDPSIEFPSAAVAEAEPAMVCGTGNSKLNVSTSMPISAGITYQWQQSPSEYGPWTTISGDLMLSDFSVEGISASTYFRCLIKCLGTTVLTSDVTFVESVNPVAPTLYDGQHCGPGSVELTGTVSSGAIFWYENPTGGTPIGVGNSFLTPPLTSDATFYASAGASSSIDTFVSGGTGYTGSSIASPFYHSWGGYKHQYLILASELLSVGIPAGTALSSIGVHVPAATGTTYNDFSISIGTTTSSTVAGSYFTGLSSVYGPVNYLPTSGVNTFDFSSSLVWDGVSNLVVQMCFSNENWGGTSTSVTYTNTTFNSHGYYYMDGASFSSVCGSSTMYTTSSRPFFYFNIAGCETDRFPVQAFIRDTPVINIMEEDGVYCLFNNEFNLNSYPEAPAGQTLLWSTGSTVPSIIVGPSAPNTKFWVEITNEWGCKNSDTATLTLNPSPEVDLGPDVLICEGGTLTLDGGPDGSSYFWNTGATTREITVEEDGHYVVLVTNSYGCMATDTIYVEVDGYAPELSGIIVDHLTSNTFRFSPHLPLYIDSYEWDFGDGSPVQTVISPVHEYSGPGTYMVTCTVTSSCATRVYTTYTNIFTGVDNADLQTMLNVYPNPTHDYINIEVDGSVHMETIRVTNILGQNVLEEIDLRNPKSVKLDVTRLPSGTYHINISTDKGNVIKTFQVVK